MLPRKCLQIATLDICQNKREFRLCNTVMKNSGWCRSPASILWRWHGRRINKSSRRMLFVKWIINLIITSSCAEYRLKASSSLKMRSETTTQRSSPTIRQASMCWIRIPIPKPSSSWDPTRSSSRWIAFREFWWTRGIHSPTRIKAPATRECLIWIRPKSSSTKSIILKLKLSL